MNKPPWLATAGRAPRLPTPALPARGPLAAILYYVVAGIAAAVLAITNGLGVVSAATSGCRLVFSTAETGIGEPTSDTWSCAQYVDLPGLLLTSVIAVALLFTARRLLVPPSGWGAPVAMGVVIGAVVGMVPLSFIAWAMDFYRLAPGPVELGVALLPLAWAMGSGFLVWRAGRGMGRRSPRRPAG